MRSQHGTIPLTFIKKSGFSPPTNPRRIHAADPSGWSLCGRAHSADSDVLADLAADDVTCLACRRKLHKRGVIGGP